MTLSPPAAATSTPPRLLALCSGFGGLEIAAEQLPGTEVVAHAELDPHAALVFEKHYPGVPNLGDITKADWHEVRDRFEAEILAAGFPCQDVSSAGRKVGIGGRRSGIWKNVAAAVDVIRPRLVLLENVAAIRTRGLDVVGADLAQIGYSLRWTYLSASAPQVGAPYGRHRWFGVAEPVEAGAASGFMPIPDQDCGFPLLPTPVVADARGTRNFTANRREGAEFNPGKTLTDFAWLLEEPGSSWTTADGVDYSAAIRRWEDVTGVPAPMPTEIGARGQRRVRTPFTEWLMGLPAGWVTDAGLPRSYELQILGNGVVWRQALFAYRWLLGGSPSMRPCSNVTTEIGA